MVAHVVRFFILIFLYSYLRCVAPGMQLIRVAPQVQACVADAAPAAERRAVAEQARKAAAALRSEAGPTGLGADAAGALQVADAALTVWLAA